MAGFFLIYLSKMLLAISSRLLAYPTLTYNNAKCTLMFSIKCAKTFPSFICLPIGAEHLILHTKIKWESIPWNWFNVLYLRNIYLNTAIIMQCLIISVQWSHSIVKRKGSGMCYLVAIVREITFSSTDIQMGIVGINSRCLMF